MVAGLWTCNPEVPGSSPALGFVSGSPVSNPRPLFVNSQLVCLPPVGIFNRCYVQFAYLFHLFIE